MNNFKDNFKKIRKDLGLSQKQFAEKLGVSRNTISLIEFGKNTPTTKLLIVIMEKFNYSANELFGQTEGNNKSETNVSKNTNIRQYYSTLVCLQVTLARVLGILKKNEIIKNHRIQTLISAANRYIDLMKFEDSKDLYMDILNSKGKNPFELYIEAIEMTSLALDVITAQLYKSESSTDILGENLLSDLNDTEFDDLFFKKE